MNAPDEFPPSPGSPGPEDEAAIQAMRSEWAEIRDFVWGKDAVGDDDDDDEKDLKLLRRSAGMREFLTKHKDVLDRLGARPEMTDVEPMVECERRLREKTAQIEEVVSEGTVSRGMEAAQSPNFQPHRTGCATGLPGWRCYSMRMPFLPKKYFQWREPKAYLWQIDVLEKAKRRGWRRLVNVLLIGSMFMGAWYLATLLPRKHHDQPLSFTIALLLAIPVGAVYVYVIPWIVSHAPSELRFYRTCLVYARANIYRKIKYADISSFSWETGEDFDILVLHPRKEGREICFGVPPEISKSAVSQFLLDHHIVSITVAGKPGDDLAPGTQNSILKRQD